jgi:alpha-N-arabinofuranosidase
MNRSALLVLLSALVSPAVARPAEPPVNWLKNGSFEQESKGRPAGWRTQKWGGDGAFEYAAVGRTGKRSLLIRSDKGGDLSWTATAGVDPHARYRLSGWIKTEDVKVTNGRGALLNIHNLQPVATQALTGTTDWTRVEVEFDTDEQDAVQINCLFGGWGSATGTAWYDDLTLEQIRGPVPLQPSITIDAAQVGPPLSKYVYGQFIEHLGRCIYGGIWAEMLEDRKFYYAVGAKESPWKTVGRPGRNQGGAAAPGRNQREIAANQLTSDAGMPAATMIREGAFVGEHSPRIRLPGGQVCGICQEGLGLVAGRAYVGYIWLSGTNDAGPVQVRLQWGDGTQDRQDVVIDKVAADFAKTPLRFTAGKSSPKGRLEVTAAGSGQFTVGTVSLMPADNVDGMRADTLALLKELDSPVYRWPGGNFVSGYNWKDGIGDRDRRPPRKNPAWLGVEHNDFGIHEFIRYCRELKTEPYIAVNSGLSGVEAAREEVEYANGDRETPQGRLRAQHGDAEPFRVKYWSIGNEMYGGWQLGHMPLEQYVKKHNQFADAMRAVDKSIQLIAVGDAGRWSEGMLAHCANHMELISEHFYCQERPGLLSHVRQIPRAVKAKADAHRRYRREIAALQGKDIRIALDEWNYWYGPHVFGELGTRYFLKDGLGIAAGVHEMARHSDLFFMANYAQTVNVIGCIKTSPTAAALETTGLVLKLYRHHFGTLPALTESSANLDAQAAWSADRKTLTLGVVNPSLAPLEIPLTVRGARLRGTGTRWQIAGPDPQAYNDPDQPPRVKIEETAVQGLTGKLTVAPCSVTLFALAAE